MTTAKPKKATVTAECVGCKHRREIEAYEVPPGQQPVCDRCYMPMVAVRATLDAR